MPDPLGIRRFLTRYQFVWWWPRIKVESEWGFGFRRLKPDESMSVIYEWFLEIGPLDIRKWVPKSRQIEALQRHNQTREDRDA